MMQVSTARWLFWGVLASASNFVLPSCSTSEQDSRAAGQEPDDALGGMGGIPNGSGTTCTASLDDYCAESGACPNDYDDALEIARVQYNRWGSCSEGPQGSRPIFHRLGSCGEAMFVHLGGEDTTTTLYFDAEGEFMGGVALDAGLCEEGQLNFGTVPDCTQDIEYDSCVGCRRELTCPDGGCETWDEARVRIERLAFECDPDAPGCYAEDGAEYGTCGDHTYVFVRRNDGNEVEYFDAAGRLVASRSSEHYDAYCNGSSSDITYGELPGCGEWIPQFESCAEWQGMGGAGGAGTGGEEN